jgi:biopolymer transport protein ExbD
MGEINMSTAKPGGPNRKNLSTRVDLTPMVDLGFLLITFFVFTTSMSKPTTIKLSMPKDSPDSTNVMQAKIMSIILSDHDQLWYYLGTDQSSMKKTDYAKGIRRAINQQRMRVRERFGDPKDLLVVIKPANGASYQNVVNMLDEMLINQVSRYMIVDPVAGELAMTLK